MTANTAPTLDTNINFQDSVNEDEVGTPVPGTWFVNHTFTPSLDSDNDPIGIAITELGGAVTGGTVEISTDGGNTWTTVTETVSETNALLLSATDLLRYTPPLNENGDRVITFHAWDGTGGYVSGSYVDISGLLGGSDPFSTDVAHHTLNITAVNDAPVAGADVAAAIEDGDIIYDSVDVNDSDVDSTALTYTLNNAIDGLFIDTDGSYSFDPANYDSLAGGASQDFTATYTVTDDFGATSEATLTISVTGVNDAPVLLSTDTSDSIPGGDVYELNVSDFFSASDIDSANVGILISAASGLDGGVLEYSANGTNWTVASNLSDSNALVLDASYKIRYTPPVVSGQLDITYHAWDGSDGLHAGQFADITAGTGDTTAYSAEAAVYSLIVDNDTGDLVALADTATVDEDAVVTGSVAENDSDSVPDAVLSYTLQGSVAGLSMDGAGNYTFDASSYDSVAAEETLSIFATYLVSDNQGNSDKSVLTIAVAGQNDDPVLASHIADFVAIKGQDFSYTISNSVFADADSSDSLALTVTLADGGALPEGIVATNGDGVLIISGNISAAGVTSLKVTASDNVSSVFDIFDISVPGILGTDGKDSLSGDDGNDVIFARGGNDKLIGNAGDDILAGEAGNDTLLGGDGNDSLNGGIGLDSLEGGQGDDSYTVELVKTKGKLVINDKLKEKADLSDPDSGDLSFDQIILTGTVSGLKSASNLVLTNNFEGLDASQTGSTKLNLIGNTRDNLIIGNDADNLIDGGKGSDTLSGGNGNDVYIVDNLGNGIDTFGDSVTEESETGGVSDTVKITVSSIGEGVTAEYALGDNIENGILINNIAFDLIGNALDNVLVGNAKANTLSGAEGNDSISGSAGADTLSGESGDDTLDGGAGIDVMDGADGNDVYYVDSAKDVVSDIGEDDAIDTVYSSAASYVLQNLDENGVPDGTGNGIENIIIIGKLAGKATGNELDNHLTGNAKNNVLDGSDGNDTLNGGAGVDKLTGGSGADVFLFTSAVNAKNADIITDFSSDDGDQIWLDVSVFKKLAALDFSFDDSFRYMSEFKGDKANGIDPIPQDENDYLIYDDAKGKLYYDADGSGKGAKVLIASLLKPADANTSDDPFPSLSATDFSVYPVII